MQNILPDRASSGDVNLTSLPVKIMLLLAGGKPGMRSTYFRPGSLPDRASSGHVTDVTSARSPANANRAVPIYYSCVSLN